MNISIYSPNPPINIEHPTYIHTRCSFQIEKMLAIGTIVPIP